MKGFRVTAFTLKLIAITTMLIDHAGVVFSPLFDTLPLRELGRISFPLYAYMIAEGCHKTKNIRKYMGRLMILAFLSEIPYDFLFENVKLGNTFPTVFLEFQSQNVFLTLTLGVFAIHIYQLFCKLSLSVSETGAQQKRPGYRWLGLFCAVMIACLCELLRSDYGSVGVLLIFALYLAPKRYQQALIMTAFMAVLYLPSISTYYIGIFAFAMISVVLVLFYNGKQGRTCKWLFYSVYPLHLILLVAVWFLYVAPRM